jgi:hypothetical protein
LDGDAPFERQALSEPFPNDDLALAVQIGQVFEDLLARELAAAGLGAHLKDLVAIVRTAFPLHVPTPDQEDPFNPFDPSTRRFVTVCGARGFDGAALYAKAKVATSPADLPPEITDPAQQAAVLAAYQDLAGWVARVWGDVAAADPATWVPERLEYKLQVAAGASGASTTLAAHPDPDGELHWSSFDVTAEDSGAASTAPVTVVIRPIHLRFRSMPAPRFWDFETNEVPLPSVKPQTRDLAKLLALDFMLVHGEDWFVLPFTMPVGSIARVDSLVVRDVFGGQTLVQRADQGAVPGATRFTLFSCARVDASGTPGDLARLFVSPPSAAAAMQIGQPREDVRFARDEMANLVWGIERAVASPIGEPRPGRERDAAVDRASPVEPAASTDITSPLRYLVETKVPVSYVPLIAVPVPSASPSIVLQRGAVVRPLPADQGGGFGTVKAAGKILRPAGRSPYQIVDEEIPRTGITIQRAVYRTRWIDGSTHIWIARRRRAGSGEAQSGLAFDQALDTKT